MTRSAAALRPPLGPEQPAGGGSAAPLADLVLTPAADRGNALGEVRRGASAYPFTYDDAGNTREGWDFTDPSAPAKRTVTWNGDGLPSEVRLLVGATERLTSFAISRPIHSAMLRLNPRLANYFKPRDARFVLRAKDLASHNGYGGWHRAIDEEAARWMSRRPNAAPDQFIEWLRWRYSQPDLRGRFPNGF